MVTAEMLKSFTLFVMLLNPFLVVIYLLDLVQDLDARVFAKVLVRAGIMSSLAFIAFAVLGDAFFSRVLQVHFASFQIFGGVVFLIMGVRFVFEGNVALVGLRGEPRHIAGSIAMPIMIGPATISASIMAGRHNAAPAAVFLILAAVALSIGTVIGLKLTHDVVKPRNETLIERYVEIAGRVAALVVGTFAVEMIMAGLGAWLQALRA